MAKTFLLIVLTGLLCLQSGVGAAGEAAWERYNQAGISAYQRGDYAEAAKQWEVALKEAQDFSEQDLRLATGLNNLALLYRAQGRYGEAEPLYKRTLAIREKALGPEHPDVALSLSNRAALYSSQGRYGEALPFMRKAMAILRTRAIQASGECSSGALSEQRTRRPHFVFHVHILSAVAGDKPDERLGSEAFEVAQLARASDTAQAVARMAARFASGNDELAQLARTRQDALQRWQFVDAELVKAVSKPTGERSADREARLREELAGLDKRIAELDPGVFHPRPHGWRVQRPRRTRAGADPA